MSMKDMAMEAAASVLSGKLNINTATVDQLMLLPGIGDTKAQAITDYRTQNGDFMSVDDITKVKGVGDKTFENIKGYLTLEGESTLVK